MVLQTLLEMLIVLSKAQTRKSSRRCRHFVRPLSRIFPQNGKPAMINVMITWRERAVPALTPPNIH